MEKMLAIELVKQQLDHELSTGKPFVSTARGIENVTKTLLDLRHEVFKSGRESSLERMTQDAVELAALSIKFIVDLM